MTGDSCIETPPIAADNFATGRDCMSTSGFVESFDGVAGFALVVDTGRCSFVACTPP